MIQFFFSILFVTSVFAIDYNAIEEDPNAFMQGEFIEMREFNPLNYDGGSLNQTSENYFKALLGTINSYKEDGKKIKIKVLGHSNARTDIYDKVIAGEKAYKEVLKNTVIFAQKIMQRLVDNGIEQELIDIDYKNTKNLGFSNLTKEGKNLSNHVIVTMYVLAQENIEIGKPKQPSNIVLPDFAINDKDVKPSVHISENTQALAAREAEAKALAAREAEAKALAAREAEAKALAAKEAEAKALAVKDIDKDGVLDIVDAELQTPKDYKVDKQGRTTALILAGTFQKNSIELSQTLEKEVMKLAQYLTRNPDLGAHIIGHTSRTKVSDMVYNIRLSLKRAKKIKQELTRYGIDVKRLTSDGKGFNLPIADNKTQAGREKNRRIEVQIKRK